MKVLMLVHGFPPEPCGGTERVVRALCEGLVRDHGDEVVVCAGSLRGGAGAAEAWEELGVPGADRPVRVLRLPRTDLYTDHWQKSASPDVHRRVRALVREERPDIVSVHHWLRLSRDLVLAAGRENAPATVHLHDHWTSCPISFRVTTDEGAACEAPCSGMVCPPCAGRVPPFTPWVSREAHFLALAQRQQDVARELRLARLVSAPSRAHAEAVARFAEGALDADRVRVLPPPPPPFDARRAPAWTDGPLVVAQWGGLSRLKGTDLLFEAVAGQGDPSAVRVVLAGGEDPPGRLDELAARFPAVAFEARGAFERERLPELLADAHAAAVPTRALESYGLVADEARTLDLPTLLADVPAFRERFRAGEGVRFVERGSADSLRAALATLLEDRGALPALADAGAGWTPPGADAAAVVARFRELLVEAVDVGPPDPSTLPPDDWYTDRMRRFELDEWDRALSERSAEELGLA